MGRITIDQSHAVMAALAQNTDWGSIDFAACELQDAIIRNQVEAGRRFTAFLKNGGKIVGAKAPPSKIIFVDRSIKPIYPDRKKKVMHSKLECSGPAQFDIATVEQWLHPWQRGNGITTGQVIYDFLKGVGGMITNCLNLRDLEEIQKEGIDFFRMYFLGKIVFGWKSVIKDREDRLRVPGLVEREGRVVVQWDWLNFPWTETHLALRFTI